MRSSVDEWTDRIDGKVYGDQQVLLRVPLDLGVS